MRAKAIFAADEAQSFEPAGSTPPGAASIVSRTLLQTPELGVTLFDFAAGQELTPHASPRRALIQVLEGPGEFLYAGKWHTLSAGAILHLPPGHTHAVRAGEAPLRMLLTLAESS